MDWTEQQKEAITRRDSGLIVSAAAGSGKTSVLVERLLRILMDESPENKVPADHMIVVTFTNDAAAEMRSRLYQALDQKLQEQPENTWLYQQQIRLQNAHICTISSFCFELIRENPYQTPPPYEKLVGDLQGALSRRINIKHRLVYEVLEEEQTVKIISLWTHYEF